MKNGSHHFCVPDIEVDYMEIMGCVDLAAEAFADGLVMERIYFRDKVRMNNCKFGNSVSFISCVFDQPFDLGRAVLDNGLLFADCTFGTPYRISTVTVSYWTMQKSAAMSPSFEQPSTAASSGVGSLCPATSNFAHPSSRAIQRSFPARSI